MSFIDLGIPVDAVESRTAAICTNAAGDSRVVIAAKGFLLVVDPITEDCRQLYFPNGHSDYPYDTFSSRSGILYVGAGSMFYAFDPFQLSYIEAIALEDKDELCGFSYAENDYGHIYMASYPQSRLYRYRPDEKDFACLGSMDSEQKYPSHMAVDAYGWVYIGTGTTKKNIIAYDPMSDTTRSLLHDDLRTIGIGLVRQGHDKLASGGHLPSSQAYALVGEQWTRVEQGMVVEKLAEDQVPASLYSGESFGKLHRQLAGDWKVFSHSLSDRELIMQHQRTSQLKTIKLRYVSDGAALSPIVLGPDQKIYGTSNHPLHFYSCDPAASPSIRPSNGGSSNQLNNMGSKVIPFGAGGNIAAYAIQGNILIGAAYPGGRLHLYDVTKPLLLEASPQRNPMLVTEHIEIHRPR